MGRLLVAKVCVVAGLLFLITVSSLSIILNITPAGLGRMSMPLVPLQPMPESDAGVLLEPYFRDERIDGRKGQTDATEEGEGSFDEEKVVELIKSLVHPRLSWRYKYDVCLMTVLRNEYYLKEFLVRNIIAGVQKIFLNDDSYQPWDTNITNLVRPFVRAGVVEHRTRIREKRAKQQQNQEMRDDWLLATVLQKGRDCAWITKLDSDEIVYPVQYPNVRLPTWLKANENKHCEIRLPWVHPYCEGVSHRRGYALGTTLLQSYKRTCFEHFLTKNFVQYHAVRYISPNVHESIDPNHPRLRSFLNLTVYDKRIPGTDLSPDPPHPILIHYYTKSLEDFVIKKEQSMGPVWRTFSRYYDGGTQGCSLQKKPFEFAPEYVADVERVMSVQFTRDPREDSAGQTFEHPVMRRNDTGDDSDYDLYVFVKQKLKDRKWFNHTCYYHTFPTVPEFIRNGTFNDGLIHFATIGFYEGKTACWEDGEEVLTTMPVP